MGNNSPSFSRVLWPTMHEKSAKWFSKMEEGTPCNYPGFPTRMKCAHRMRCLHQRGDYSTNMTIRKAPKWLGKKVKEGTPCNWHL